MLYHRTLIAFANQLVSKVTPQTVANYPSHLAAVFAIARAAWGYQLDQNAMKDAFVVTKLLGITTRSRARDRRPTTEICRLEMAPRRHWRRSWTEINLRLLDSGAGFGAAA
jgi:hypothetical protein